MNTRKDKATILNAMERLYQDPAVYQREYYSDFRRRWDALLYKALGSGECRLEHRPEAVLTVPYSYGGVDFTLHFDQLKMADWFQQELLHKRHTVFLAKRLKRSSTGVLTFHESICHYDANEPEPALTDEIKNIFACALPGIPPALCIVYGNKWVNSRFHALRKRSLQLFLIQTDYVPVFLSDSFELCLYLFLMDCCIIKENYTKVKDSDLRQFLHVFRPSPMLKIKGLADAEA
ncbi:MAG: hypothetical protein VB071_09725 [Lawsonibacter sp.]|nr:hypothetical protein [Lawsonibacter sp.]